MNVTTPSECPKLKGDSHLLNSLFRELIDNAIKYNKDAGSININFELEKDKIKISIENAGEGIDEHDIENIFDKFRTLKDMKHHGGGLGLGLPLVKAIIDAHGGSISAHSTSHSFTVILALDPLYF